MGIFADAIRRLTGTQVISNRKNTAANLRAVYASISDAVAYLEGLQRGANILSGVGPPAAALGLPGDAYIDNGSSNFYQKSTIAVGAGSGWVFKFQLKGAAGNRYYTGQAAPTAFTPGKVGDLYYHHPTTSVYSIYDYPAVVAAGVNPWRRRFNSVAATGGGGGLFADDIPVSLSDGKTIGRYVNGETIPAAGKTAEEVMRLVAIESIYPTYTPASLSLGMSAAPGGEVGEVVTLSLTATYAAGHAGALTSLSVKGDGNALGSTTTANPLVVGDTTPRNLLGRRYRAYVSYAAGAPLLVTPDNTPDDRVPAVRTPAAPQAAETDLASNEVVLTGYYRLFYGPVAAGPVTSAQVRTLAGSQLTSAGNSGILNTGTTATRFAIVLPPDTVLVNVTDLDNVMANVTGAYVAQPQVTVNDAGGNPIGGYTPYVYAAADPYKNPARHQFTIA